MPVDTANDVTPKRIGRYEIQGQLGQGGMATIYRARDPRFEREVAIKVLPHAMMHDPTFRARFEREARTIAKLEHSAIVPVYDYGEENGQPYLVMRHMPGGSLADRLDNGPLSLAEAAAILDRLAPALDEAHAQGIVHRDLKPDNILFDRSGDCFVADFGIAKMAEATAALTGSLTIGTPAYMSPEQARGELDVDGRSDIYSLGAILFEILTGRQPYEADTPMGVAVRHITDPVPDILATNPGLPAACDELIQQAMAKEREDRFQSVQAMAAALRAFAPATNGPVQQAPEAPPARQADPAPAAPAPDAARTPDGAAVTAPVATALLPAAHDRPAADAPAPAAHPATSPNRATDPISTLAGNLRRRSRRELVLLGIGALLVLLGVRLLNLSWTASIIVPGGLLLYLGYREARTGRRMVLAVSGSMVLATGVLLLYQAIFRHFASWAYGWALVAPTAVGVALMLAGRWNNRPEQFKQGTRVARIGLIIFAFGWVFFEVAIGISQRPVAAVLWLPVIVGAASYGFWRSVMPPETAGADA